MTALPAQVAKLLPRLGDAQGAELVAVRDAIDRVLRAAGLDWHDLADHCRPPDALAASTGHTSKAPGFADMAWGCRHLDRGSLTAGERAFVVEMSALRFGRQPSPRQLAWLQRIYDRLSSRRAA